jgi:hypothetical protein
MASVSATIEKGGLLAPSDTGRPDQLGGVDLGEADDGHTLGIGGGASTAPYRTPAAASEPSTTAGSSALYLPLAVTLPRTAPASKAWP